MGYYLIEHGAAPAPENRPAAVSDCMGSKTPIGAPFGKAILSTKYWDSETKTLAYQLRDYGPGIGRWFSRDPIGINGGKNIYNFCLNSTQERFDAFGLNSCCCCCAEKLLPTVTPYIVLTGPIRMIGHTVKFGVTLKYVKDERIQGDCDYTWEEWSDRDIDLLPGDKKYHDLTLASLTEGCTESWAYRDKPCEGEDSFSFLDIPGVKWGSRTSNPPQPPIKWEHKIRVTLTSTKGCPCRCRKITAEVDRYMDWKGGTEVILKAGTMVMCLQ